MDQKYLTNNLDAVQSEFEVLFRMCNKDNCNSIISLNEVMQELE